MLLSDWLRYSPSISTHRSHVVARLFSNRSQMTSNVVRTKNCHKGAAECITDVLTIFWRLLWSITLQTQSNMEFIILFYTKRSKNASSFKSMYNSSYYMTNIIAFEDYMHLSYKPLSYQFTTKSRFWELHWNSQDQNLPVNDCKRHPAQF